MASSQSVLDNLLLNTDSYKITHHKQYPPGTTKIYSYFECRGGVFPEVVFFGLQYVMKRWLLGQVVTEEKIQQAAEITKLHLSQNVFNIDGWRYILKNHGGRLPIRIKAVKEGSIVPTKNVLFTVENTDPHCFWLTNYIETLLVQVWYPITVATVSRCMKQSLAKYLHETAENFDGLPFQLHDFGFRGVSSVESARIGGLAHLVNFMGSDTMAALLTAREYYHCPMAGFSIPAAEHSTMTTWGKANEVAAYQHMLETFPNGIVAVVSDSYDIFKCCDEIWGKKLKDLVVKRGKTGSTLVIRPDSGDPATTLVKVLTILEKHFGSVRNLKGYKMLPSYLRLIQGDGIDYSSLPSILETLKTNQWSVANIAFGCGGGLLQRLDRDTQRCAFKCSYAEVNGKSVNVYKDPVTDSGKKSKKGLLTLECHKGVMRTTEEGSGDPTKDLLVTVFENGKLCQEYTLDEVRERAELDIVKQSKKK